MNRTILLLAALAAFSPPSRAAAQTPPGKLRVYSSIQPQAYFVERVGCPYVEAGVLVPPGQSVHTYEPTPSQLVDVANSRVFFTIGVPFEKGFAHRLSSSNPDMLMVDMARDVERIQMEEEEEHDGHVHPKGEPDPHVWLDPLRVSVMAETIAEVLIELDPERREHYAKNLKRFQDELIELDEQIREALTAYSGRPLYVFHPAYGYFAARYGLHQVAVETGGKEPGPRQLSRLVDRAKKDGARVIFVQPQFSDKSARTLAREIGAAVVPLDPLAWDYVWNLEQMAKQVRSALESRP